MLYHQCTQRHSEQYYVEKQKPLRFGQKNDSEQSDSEYEEVRNILIYYFNSLYKYMHKWYAKSISK